MNNLIPCEICNTFIPFNQYIEHCEECYIRTSIANRNMNENSILPIQNPLTNPNMHTLANMMMTMMNQNQRATITMVPIDIERLQRQPNDNSFVMNTMIEELNGGIVNVPTQNIERCYENMEGNDLVTCSICLDESTPNEKEFVRTTCNHTFCKECISRWLNMRHRCPVCNNDFNTNEDTIDPTLDSIPDSIHDSIHDSTSI
jgi:hypothetical protein